MRITHASPLTGVIATFPHEFLLGVCKLPFPNKQRVRSRESVMVISRDLERHSAKIRFRYSDSRDGTIIHLIKPIDAARHSSRQEIDGLRYTVQSGRT